MLGAIVVPPSPFLGEGRGEGLDGVYFTSLITFLPASLPNLGGWLEDGSNNLGARASSAPHPQPFSQREKGEKIAS